VKLEVRCERMVVISDLHLGNPYSLAGRRLGDFIDHWAGQGYALCINGDGLEIVQSSFMALASDALGPLAALRRVLLAGAPVYYVVGNHDIALEHLLDTWLGEHISPFLDVWSGGARVRIEHGHLYDPFFVRSPRTYEALTRAVGPLLHLYPDVYRVWSWYQSTKARLRGLYAKDAVSPYHEAASMLLARGFDAVIFGHTHGAELLELDDGVYVNAGNWMRSSNFVRIDAGAVSLHRWSDGHLLAGPTRGERNSMVDGQARGG
jgi:UDP-2,3-diacylglucosamine pyrophosphatase LpxH